MQFVRTEMALKVDSEFIDLMGGFVPMEMVVKGTSINDLLHLLYILSHVYITMHGIKSFFA